MAPSLFKGFAGINGSIFNSTPEWVDSEKEPGYTSQTKELGLSKTMKDIFNARFFFFSPNLVWFCIAMSIHLMYPYDMESAREGFDLSWILPRFVFNLTLGLVYYGFFFSALYVFSYSQRKFSPESYPTFGNMMHNMYYWGLGIVQWTFWECVMTRLWATDKVGFKSNEEIMNDNYLMALNLMWILLVPIWRDLHFYIAHRFIHIRAIYKYVHSLHHRNTDPEPFSGMTMHPVEHLYYFSNAFIPSLYCNSLSPLIFLWCFVHLTLAPGAGHSGFEDHFQADQYHYIHHAKFECNYGSPSSAFIDQFFGTFRDKLGTSKTYKGEWKNNNGEKKTKTKKKKKVWSAQSYLGLPATPTHMLYTAFWVSLFPLTWWGVTRRPSTTTNSLPIDTMVAFTVSVAPIIVALLCCALSGDRMSWRWPFHKEKLFGTFGLFIVLGMLACVMPMYHATKWACSVASL